MPSDTVYFIDLSTKKELHISINLRLGCYSNLNSAIRKSANTNLIQEVLSDRKMNYFVVYCDFSG